MKKIARFLENLAIFFTLGRSESLTVRQLIAKLGGGRGHRSFAGTAEQVADDLEDFVEQVVPIPQRRGLFRTDYTATTLRGSYGLAHRPSRYTVASARSA